MASITKRGDKWRAEVYKNGKRASKSFATKAEASLWAASAEVELSNAQAGKIPDKTFADLLDRCQSASKFDQVSAFKFDHPRT
jgi:hypothetical protein